MSANRLRKLPAVAIAIAIALILVFPGQIIWGAWRSFTVESGWAETSGTVVENGSHGSGKFTYVVNGTTYTNSGYLGRMRKTFDGKGVIVRYSVERPSIATLESDVLVFPKQMMVASLFVSLPCLSLMRRGKSRPRVTSPLYSHRLRCSVIAGAVAFVVAIFGGILPNRFFGWVALGFLASLGTLYYQVWRLPSAERC